MAGGRNGGSLLLYIDKEESNTRIFSEQEWAKLVSELSLSPRQEQIVRYLFDGLADKQIALSMEIAVPTVRTHLTRLFSKLHVNDRSELILHVFREFRRNNGH